MCLFSRKALPMVAEKDIVCYKSMDATNVICNGNVTNEFIYYTPFLHMEVSGDIINGKEPLVALGEKSVTGCGVMFNVGCGYIHSYSTDYLTKNWGYFKYKMKHMSYAFGHDAYFKCIIPKGCEYYASSDGLEFASDEIIFVGELTRFAIWKEYICIKIKKAADMLKHIGGF